MKVDVGPLTNRVLLLQSAEDLLKSGCFVRNYDIPSSICPTEKMFVSDDDKFQEVRGEDAFLLVHDQDTSGAEVLRLADEMGFEPSGVRSLLCLGIGYPELQQKYPVVALGEDHNLAGFLYADPSSSRKVYIGKTSGVYEAGCRFLCVKK